MARQKWEEWANNEDRLAVLSAWARAGLTDERIAKEIGISRSTLGEWKKKYASIEKALSMGKEMADRKVENSLYEMTQGKMLQVRKAFKVKQTSYDSQGRKVEKEELQTIEEDYYVEPDIKAIMFWLKNRKPEVWRDKVVTDTQPDGETGEGIVILTQRTAQELREEIADEKNKETGKGEETR